MCDIPHTRGFWSGLECPEFGSVEGGPGQRGLITSRQGSRRGSVVQHAEGGINSSLIATEGGFGVIHILTPLILPSPLSWNLFKTGAPTYVPWGFASRRLSHPSCESRKRCTGCIGHWLRLSSQVHARLNFPPSCLAWMTMRFSSRATSPENASASEPKPRRISPMNLLLACIRLAFHSRSPFLPRASS